MNVEARSVMTFLYHSADSDHQRADKQVSSISSIILHICCILSYNAAFTPFSLPSEHRSATSCLFSTRGGIWQGDNTRAQHGESCHPITGIAWSKTFMAGSTGIILTKLAFLILCWICYDSNNFSFLGVWCRILYHLRKAQEVIFKPCTTNQSSHFMNLTLRAHRRYLQSIFCFCSYE